MPDNLWRSPLSHTLSKDLLMSQNTAPTSLTLSTHCKMYDKSDWIVDESHRFLSYDAFLPRTFVLSSLVNQCLGIWSTKYANQRLLRRAFVSVHCHHSIPCSDTPNIEAGLDQTKKVYIQHHWVAIYACISKKSHSYNSKSA